MKYYLIEVDNETYIDKENNLWDEDNCISTNAVELTEEELDYLGYSIPEHLPNELQDKIRKVLK